MTPATAHDASAAHTGVSTGTVIGGDFEIESELASGGMGVIYVARQLSTGRARALKMILPNLVRVDELRRRFEQEARVGSQIESEHVVEVIAAGVDRASGMPFIAMELLEGEDLLSHVTREGALSIERASHILAQLFHALEAAHQVGVVHRDLKPENVFLKRSRREGAPVTVKLLDLGIAKIVADARSNDTGAVGTPLWMAPEQTGGKVGPHTDVWAIGLLAFWMLTGKSYWLAAESDAPVMGILREVVHEPLAKASARAAELGVPELLPPGFDIWFERCVDRDVETRFRDAGVARRAFERMTTGGAHTIAASSSQSAVAELPARKPRGRLPTIALAVAATGAALALGWRLKPGVIDTSGADTLAGQKSTEIAVSISTRPPGARLYLDGRRLESNPFAGRRPRDGSVHRLRAEAERHQPVEIDISYDSDIALELSLNSAVPDVRVATADRAPSAAPPASPEPTRPIRAHSQPKAAAKESSPAVPSAEMPRPEPEPTPPRPSKPGIPIDTELPWSDDKP